MIVEALVVILAIALALASRPWRLYQDPSRDPGGETAVGTRVAALVARLGPALALLAVLPILWTLPGPAPVATQLHWSGAGLATLLLGWPVAVPLLVLVALAAGLVDPSLALPELLRLACWQGIVPATLSLLAGVGLQRCFGHHIFIYLIGRAFFGTVFSIFAASMLAAWLHDTTAPAIAQSITVARWLMAWGDGIVTGMIASVLVAYAPGALATWSDRRYLRPPAAAADSHDPDRRDD